ncbi:MAG: nucleoside recognition domain-containing protein [Candidatus Gastranaerophilaceae bacterium]|jgi:spore maturation protein A
MFGYIWLFLIIASVVIGGINGKISAVTEAVVDNAKLAVDISISLIGIMTFWLGIMKLADKSGIVENISRLIKPATKFLFPEIPQDSPALGNIAMNISANALGVTNAATPIGLKAMKELQKINPDKNTATNAMCTFLAINTGGFQLVPASVIAVLSATGSKNPTEIIGPTLFASGCATIAGIIAVKLLEKFSPSPKNGSVDK